MSVDQVSSADYDRALELWPTELLSRAKNLAVKPVWFEGEDRFWFRDESRTGHRYVAVDAATGAQSPAFDHDLVARVLGADPAALPIDDLRPASDGASITLTLTGQRASVQIDLVSGTRRTLPEPDRGVAAGPGGQVAFVRDYDLYVRDAAGAERRLTHDGEEFFAWATIYDGDTTRVERDRTGRQRSMLGCYWSPDGARLLVQRVDERAVEPYPYLESVRADGNPRPLVHWVRNPLNGDAARTVHDWFVLDARTGSKVAVAGLPGRLAIRPWDAWWSPDSTRVYVIAATPSVDHVAVVEVTAETGAVRLLHEERSPMFDFNPVSAHEPNVRHLPERGELLWYSSAASGWGHIYAVDLEKGGVGRQLTDGEWPVFDIIATTPEHLFFTAGGREPGRHPYHRHLYRVDIAGDGPNSGLRLLTPEDADHAFPGRPNNRHRTRAGIAPDPLRSPVSPSGRFIVDSISTVDQPPVTVLRDIDGTRIAEVARADVSGLAEIGWTPPEVFTAKAADGVTDLYGVLVKPRRFAEQDSWPVLERIYGGPQTFVQPRSFLEGLNGSFMYGLYSLAEMGFVVAVLDGPGTPYRSKAFRDLTWGQTDRWGVAHHRAALEGAAATRPWMDLSNVGVSGHSYGGYATVMAMLLQPDFYRVGFSSSGMYDPMWSYPRVLEPHLGSPDFGDGRYTKNEPDEVPENFRHISPSTHVDNLVGTLALAYGDLDTNIEPAALLRFVDVLTRAGKSYDLIYFPGRGHGHTTEPYHQKRLWDYFIEHVQHRRPLRHHRLDVPAGTRMRFS